ncbi:helix-turn-helix domain-containing protein [Xanthomonas campestris]|uniref:Repressor n=1 Tax=Xanthomonas phage fSU1 TaxID=3238781 RepID=A0AB39CF31_9VIRU|nr:helix-turn-helix domain-containing protein [Xanthomonas campestris]
MNRQEALIRRALLGSKATSYGALAKKLGVSAATMSQWRSETSKLSNERVVELSEMAGDDPGVWLISMMAEQCNITPLRRSLENIVQQVGKIGAIMLVLAGGLFPTAGKAKPIENQGLASVECGYSVYYVIITPAGASVQTIAYDNPVKAVRWPQ